MAKVIVDNVRVEFPIYATQRNLRSAIFQRATGGLIQRKGKKHDRVVVRALAGVSFTLDDGDRLGLIGHNGSGKSTLLKVIAGIYEPVGGRLLVEGRVTPLFDMMPGLDGEDSGYENIITAGMLLGMSREEIESRIPDIEEFSELGEYLSLPVRTYSAGMTTRLGFALVTALHPDVLLMDEGIGAGDARFAERAEQRLNAFVGRSRIVVLASHAPSLIRAICNKGALLAAGKILAIGPVDEVLDHYDAILHGATRAGAGPARLASSGSAAGQDEAESSPVDAAAPVGGADTGAAEAGQKRAKSAWHRASFAVDPKVGQEWGGYGDEWAQCIGGTVETLDGIACDRLDIHVPFRLCLRYRLLQDSPHRMVPNFHLYDDFGRRIVIAFPPEPGPTAHGEYQACCVIAPFVLNVGRYSVMPVLSSYELAEPNHFSAPDALRFEVVEQPGVDARRHGWSRELPGVTRLRLDWQYTVISAGATRELSPN